MTEQVPDLEARNGGVLSDRDLELEIRHRTLLTSTLDEDKNEGWWEGGLQGDAFDFRIGHVISRRLGRITEDKAITLRPGEMATLLSAEELHLPMNVSGVVVPRNGPARKGILMLNAGHVDPGHIGPIQAQVVNLSNQDRSLRLHSFQDGVFSVVFSYLHTTTQKERTNQPLQRRVRDTEADVGEQAETLVLSEHAFEERFVSKRVFTPLFFANVVSLLLVVAATVAIALPLGIVNKKTFAPEVELDQLALLLAAVSVGVAIGLGLLVPIASWFRRRLRRLWLEGASWK